MSQGDKVALVVESVPALAETILYALTRDNLACEVVLTRDGEETLDYLFGQREYDGRDTHIMPCIVLLDLSLPHSGGLDVLGQIRTHERTRLIPVVMFSSSDERIDTTIPYILGANSYIGTTPKSGSFAEVLREVARYWFVLNEPPPTPEVARSQR